MECEVINDPHFCHRDYMESVRRTTLRVENDVLMAMADDRKVDHDQCGTGSSGNNTHRTEPV